LEAQVALAVVVVVAVLDGTMSLATAVLVVLALY
jgi:hypothetical protein